MNLNQIRNKRAIILTAFMLITAVSFWTISRYPQLGFKSNISQVQTKLDESVMQSTFGPTVRFPIEESDEIAVKIKKTTLNWIFTNLRGMSFGLVIGVGFLTLLQYFKRRHVKNRFLNSAIGMVLGIPLGICSNCVAPVARGAFQGGAKIESALALMFSSPGLNIIVLTMLFATFPLKLAILKVVFTLVLILLIVPILSIQKIETKVDGGESCDINFDKEEIQRESWVGALKGTCSQYFNNFIYLFVRAVPLMFLAGFLGASLSHLINLEYLSGESFSFFVILIAVIVATFLPMPIAVDILLAQTLMLAGVSLPIVSAVLFCLGSYSIYSFFIVYRTFNLKLALQIYLIIATLGLASGYLVYLT